MKSYQVTYTIGERVHSQCVRAERVSFHDGIAVFCVGTEVVAAFGGHQLIGFTSEEAVPS